MKYFPNALKLPDCNTNEAAEGTNGTGALIQKGITLLLRLAEVAE
jgi:hypothetical protein